MDGAVGGGLPAWSPFLQLPQRPQHAGLGLVHAWSCAHLRALLVAVVRPEEERDLQILVLRLVLGPVLVVLLVIDGPEGEG